MEGVHHRLVGREVFVCGGRRITSTRQRRTGKRNEERTEGG